VAETGGNKRGWAAVARVFAIPLAVGITLDEIARAAGAWWILEKVAEWVPPFAKAHEPKVDLVAVAALLAVAFVVLKVLRPRIPDELRGLGYIALLMAGAMAFYVVENPAGGAVRAGRLTAGNSSKSQLGHTPSGSGAGNARSRPHHPSDDRARSASSDGSHDSESTGARTAASTGASDIGLTGSTDRVEAGRHASDQSNAVQSAPHKTTPAHETGSPAVEFETSKSAATAPASHQTSPAVEVKSEKEHSSGIEVASN
jgi:hypothetical protein